MIKAMYRHDIDAEFAPMAEDDQYQREAQRIANDFAESDAEAIRAGEWNYARSALACH
jgi:hypothetical protein